MIIGNHMNKILNKDNKNKKTRRYIKSKLKNTDDNKIKDLINEIPQNIKELIKDNQDVKLKKIQDTHYELIITNT